MFEKVQDPPTNLAILALHPRNIGIDGQTYTPLQLQYRPQANGIPSESTATRKGPGSECPSAYVDQTERTQNFRQATGREFTSDPSLSHNRPCVLSWQGLSFLGYGFFKRAREFIETWNKTTTPVHGHISMLRHFARVLEAQRHVVTSQLSRPTPFSSY